MYVGEGDAKDVIRWFKENSRAGWLGFFVAGDDQYNRLLNDVLAHGAVFDVVSGYDIDLFLFGGGQTINIFDGSDLTVDAVPLTELKQVDDYSFPEIKHIGDVNRSAAHVKQITKASVTATHRIAEILGLGVDDLPSLALIGKDFDFGTKEPKLVLRTRGQADADFLIEFIRSARRIMERSRKAFLVSLRMPTQGSIAQAQGILPKIEAEKAAVTKFTRRIERHSVSLCQLLCSAGIHVPAGRLAAAILDGSSSEQALRDAADEQAIEAARLEKILQQPSIIEIVQWLEKSHEAVKNARNRMERFYSKLPSVEILQEYLALNECIFSELETLVKRFDRKISFKITADTIAHFFNLSTAILEKAKKLISAAVAVKTGGASLLS
jgi:hypothetical protein